MQFWVHDLFYHIDWQYDSREDAKYAKFGEIERYLSLRSWHPFDGVYPEHRRMTQDMLGPINFVEAVLLNI